MNFSREVRRPCSVSGLGETKEKNNWGWGSTFKHSKSIYLHASHTRQQTLLSNRAVGGQNSCKNPESYRAAFSVQNYTPSLGLLFCIPASRPTTTRGEGENVSFHNLLKSVPSRWVFPLQCSFNYTRDGDTYFLPCHQQVLVHIGAQEAGVAVTFHQLVDVVLIGKSG